jgi:hypothetical protein
MKAPSVREIDAAIKDMTALRYAVDDADAEEWRKAAPESSEEMQARMARSRVVERLASIDESIKELERWAHQLQQRQSRRFRLGH